MATVTRSEFRADYPRKRNRGGLLEVGVGVNFNGMKNLRGVNASDLAGPFSELMEPVKETAREIHTPHIKTGDLWRSIRVEVREATKTRLKVGVTAGDSSVNGVGVFYAPFIELGTGSHPAYPYLRPGWDAHKTEIREKMKAAIWAVIKSKARKS